MENEVIEKIAILQTKVEYIGKDIETIREEIKSLNAFKVKVVAAGIFIGASTGTLVEMVKIFLK